MLGEYFSKSDQKAGRTTIIDALLHRYHRHFILFETKKKKLCLAMHFASLTLSTESTFEHRIHISVSYS